MKNCCWILYSFPLVGKKFVASSMTWLRVIIGRIQLSFVLNSQRTLKSIRSFSAWQKWKTKKVTRHTPEHRAHRVQVQAIGCKHKYQFRAKVPHLVLYRIDCAGEELQLLYMYASHRSLMAITSNKILRVNKQSELSQILSLTLFNATAKMSIRLKRI